MRGEVKRIETLRRARNAPHVTFASYLKTRHRFEVMLVFEGIECPTVYMGWVSHTLIGIRTGHLIAQGKRNVLELRDIVRRNSETAEDVIGYIVDRDYDLTPAVDAHSDVYVTGGYAVENELIERSTVERFMSAHFGIVDANDVEDVARALDLYEDLILKYFLSTYLPHKVVFVCRRLSIRCTPGSDASSFIDWTWGSDEVSPRTTDLAELLEILKVDETQVPRLLAALEDDSEFDTLDPMSEWRGKYHLSFVRRFLVGIAGARRDGTMPFRNRGRVITDPASPSLMSVLASQVQTPQRLRVFLRVLEGRLAASIPT